MVYDYIIIGGGIVGLSVAYELGKRNPALRLLVMEKEADWAQHQTGRNSGVIHSGIYYKPGSLKARLCRTGNQRMVEFCRAHEIRYELCGKVIVATGQEEMPRLETLYQRGLANQLEVRKLGPEQVKEIEPHVRCVAGLHVPGTGIVNYATVCRKLAELIQTSGGILKLNTKLTGMRNSGSTTVLESSSGEFQTRCVINCAGLHSDRVARLSGAKPEAKIVPFRGEYYELKPERRSLVKHLIYPVPNPDFP